MLIDDLTDDSINEEFKAFVSSCKKNNKHSNPINPEDKQNHPKKQVLKIKDKLKIIEYVEEGHTILNASQKFKVPRTTISTWLKTKDTLKAFKNTEKRTMHPGAQPKNKINNKIISNLRELISLFKEDEENDTDEDEEEEEE